MKNKILLKNFFTALILTISSFCQAQTTNTLGYYPNTPLHLGSGFDLDHPQVPHALTPFQSFQTDSQNTVGQWDFKYSIISNYSSLQKALKLDAYLGVSNIGYDVNASYGMSSSSFYSSSSITLAMSAICDYGTIRMIGVLLDTTAQGFLNRQEYQRFTNAYGDNYVAQKSLGVSATLFLTLKNLTSSQQSSLRASLNGQVGTVAAGVAFNSAISAASASNSLEIDIKTNGGSGWSTLYPAIVNAASLSNPITEIQNAFSAFVSNFDISNAQVTAFTFAPFSQFDPNLVNNSLLNIKVDRLGSIYGSYNDVKTKKFLLDYILGSEFYQDFHNNGDAQEAIRLKNEYTNALSILYNAYVACKSDPCSNASTCCIDPAFNFNDQFLNKFNDLPFRSGIGANPNYTYQYINHAFTFTSNVQYNVGLGGDFFYCSSTNPFLAGKRINTRIAGTVWNSGTSSGACGAVNGSYTFQFNLYTQTTPGGTNTNSVIAFSALGDRGYSQTTTDSVGSDGNFTIQFQNSSVTCSNNTNITLRQGATVELSIVNQTPDIDAIITPSNATICQGSSVVLSANTCVGCSYLWNNGETTQSITVNSSDNYYVTVTNSTSSNTSYWSTVTVKQPPAQPTISGSTSTIICSGSSNTLTANSSGCTDCIFTWLPGNLVGSTLTATVAGTYTVISSNGCSPAATSLPITLTISQPPAAPTFSVNGCNLVAPYVNGYSYQWYMNDTFPIPGATTRFCFADTTGYYGLKVTDANGCSNVSFGTLDTLLYCPLVGIDDFSLSQQVNIYPNPAINQLTILTSSFHNEFVIISVMNGLGEIMQEEKLKWSNEINLNIKYLPSGIYFIVMKTENGRVVKKFVKQ